MNIVQNNTYDGGESTSGDPFGLGEVSCWSRDSGGTPHMWPSDASASLDHFAVFYTGKTNNNGTQVYNLESSIYSNNLNLISGQKYKVKFDYMVYYLQAPFEPTINFAFTNDPNFDPPYPGSNDAVSACVLNTASQYYNLLAYPPMYESGTWHSNTYSECFEMFRIQW